MFVRRIRKRVAWVGAASLCFFLWVPAASQADDPRPNVILIMADDMGWGDTGYYGHPWLKTPHLDQMAKDGIRFDRFYAGAPVCSPTRGSVLTGRHPFRYGIQFANQGHVKAEERTLAEILKAAGYRTGHFGKWHLGTLTNTVKESNRGGRAPNHYAPPWDHGFDVCYSTEAKTPTWWNEGDYERYGTHYWTGPEKQVGPDGMVGDDSRLIMDPAIRFVKKAVQDDQPFFAVIWFHAPHKPIVAGKKYLDMYREIPGFEPAVKESAAHYYGCITALDEQVGRLRAALAASGAEKNTLIAFCSDNGPENRTAGRAEAQVPGQTDAVQLKGRKRRLTEGGIRVPGLMVWPAKIRPGTSCDLPCVTSDYLPTVLAAAGISAKQDRGLDGVDILPMVSGQLKRRPSKIGFQSQGQKALVGNRYKALFHEGEWALYDLIEDPGETRDLAGEQPKRLKKMQNEFETWARSCEQSAGGQDYHAAEETR
ncbi:MAG: sulfatase-like hydrolase/transferase [Mariniblastus sp.]|nr:sulfatase-like hydrolase/transferase [Mariniblastus sp.]